MNGFLILINEALTVSKPESFLVALIGVGTVFLVLLIIIGLLYVFKAIFGLPVFSSEKKASPATESASAAPIVEDLSEDEELVAAITAAISMTLSEEKGTTTAVPFVIRSIHRK